MIQRVSGNRPESEMTPSEFFVAGGLCGLAAALVESPIDLVKCQLQSAVFHERPAFNSFGGCVAAILRQVSLLLRVNMALNHVFFHRMACSGSGRAWSAAGYELSLRLLAISAFTRHLGCGFPR